MEHVVKGRKLLAVAWSFENDRTHLKIKWGLP